MNLYTGVVENRNDPLRLGRCQVRVVGLHTDNRILLSTEDLPWAYPLQPVTSAAMNGIGHSPVGPVEGTWVVVIFRDEDQQQPIILGTVGGIPQQERKILAEDDDVVLFDTKETQDQPTPKARTAPVTDGQGQPVLDGSGNPLQTQDFGTSDGIATGDFIGPLSRADYVKYTDAIGKKESSSVAGGSINYERRVVAGAQNYGLVNTIGYTGKYQFGALALADLGYLKQVIANKEMPTSTLWTGKGGVSSYEAFRTSASIQEAVMEEYTKKNYKILRRIGVITDDMEKNTVCGWLAVAHNQGPGAAKKLKGGIDSKDGYGTSARAYYNVGYAAIDNATPSLDPGNTSPAAPVGSANPDGSVSAGVPQDREARLSVGFYDPNLVYPLDEFINEPDTNRLARGRVKNTIVEIKDETRDVGVPIAIEGTWNQPLIPYNAKYPYNHVYQSESGHVQEFDDTPENERYHLYHRTGTYTEIDSNGTQVDYIVGDYYSVMSRNGNIHIKGKCNLTVDGDVNILVQSNANIEVFGKTTAHFRNDVDVRVSGKMDLNVKEELNIHCSELNIETHEGDANIKTAGAMYTQSGGLYSVKAGGAIGIDGSTIDLNSGKASNAGNSGLDEGDVKDRAETLDPQFEDLQIPTRSIEDEQVFESSDETTEDASPTSVYEAKKENGEVSERPADEEATTVPVTPTTEPIPSNCAVIFNLQNFPRSFQLSTNWNFAEIVNSKHSLVDQVCGELDGKERLYTKQEIMCNMKNTCDNILEKVLTVIPKNEIIVTSSYRQRGVVGKESKKSQHPKGQAVDLVIRGKNFDYQAHYDLVVKLQKVIAYDQMILEYRDTSRGRIVWIHISYNANGGRKQAFTMLNDKTYRQGFVLLS